MCRIQCAFYVSVAFLFHVANCQTHDSYLSTEIEAIKKLVGLYQYGTTRELLKLERKVDAMVEWMTRLESNQDNLERIQTDTDNSQNRKGQDVNGDASCKFQMILNAFQDEKRARISAVNKLLRRFAEVNASWTNEHARISRQIDTRVDAMEENCTSVQMTATFDEEIQHLISSVLKLEESLDKSQKENEDIKRKVEALLRSNIHVDRNLALHKPTSQSSIYTNEWSTIQRPAVDGSENNHWNTGSCMHTQPELGPWWRVDLGNEVIVGKVVIVNRADCCGSRLANLVITVRASGADNSAGQECGRFEGPGNDGQMVTIPCHQTLVGRVVQVQIDGMGTLTFCEVMVYSRQ